MARPSWRTSIASSYRPSLYSWCARSSYSSELRNWLDIVGRILRALTGSTVASKMRSRSRNQEGASEHSHSFFDEEKIASGAHCRSNLRGHAGVRFEQGEIGRKRAAAG